MPRNNSRPKKNTIEIFIPKNDDFFRYYNEMSKNRCTYLELDGPKRNGVSRSLGIRLKPLIKNNFITPPISRTHGGNITGIILKRDVKIQAVKKGNGKLFKFFR